eukprot:422965-Lingulodinium_polyedra.AAC.1
MRAVARAFAARQILHLVGLLSGLASLRPRPQCKARDSSFHMEALARDPLSPRRHVGGPPRWVHDW